MSQQKSKIKWREFQKSSTRFIWPRRTSLSSRTTRHILSNFYAKSCRTPKINWRIIERVRKKKKRTRTPWTRMRTLSLPIYPNYYKTSRTSSIRKQRVWGPSKRSKAPRQRAERASRRDSGDWKRMCQYSTSSTGVLCSFFFLDWSRLVVCLWASREKSHWKIDFWKTRQRAWRRRWNRRGVPEFSRRLTWTDFIEPNLTRDYFYISSELYFSICLLLYIFYLIVLHCYSKTQSLHFPLRFFKATNCESQEQFVEKSILIHSCNYSSIGSLACTDCVHRLVAIHPMYDVSLAATIPSAEAFWPDQETNRLNYGFHRQKAWGMKWWPVLEAVHIG